MSKEFFLETPLPKKRTKYLTKVCPSFTGQNFVKYFVRFLGNGVKEKMLLRFTDLSSSLRKNKDDLDAKCSLAKNQPNSGQKKKKKPRLPCFFLALYSKQILTEILIFRFGIPTKVQTGLPIKIGL